MTESEPQNCRSGYARVSTYGHTLETRIAQLCTEGCALVVGVWKPVIRIVVRVVVRAVVKEAI